MRDSFSNHVTEKINISLVHPKTVSSWYPLPRDSSPRVTPNIPYSFLTAPTPLIPLFPVDPLPRLPRTPLHLLKNSDNHPNNPHDRRHNAVPNFSFGGIIAELEPQAAIDYPQGNDYPAHPDVGVRPDGAYMVFLEVGVVGQAAEWLDDEEADNDETDDWVVGVELCAGVVVLV